MAQFQKTWQCDIPYEVNFMGQIPVIVVQNVLYSVKLRQEGYAWHVTGPYPKKNRPFFQRPWRDRAIGLIYSGNFSSAMPCRFVVTHCLTHECCILGPTAVAKLQHSSACNNTSASAWGTNFIQPFAIVATTNPVTTVLPAQLPLTYSYTSTRGY